MEIATNNTRNHISFYKFRFKFLAFHKEEEEEEEEEELTIVTLLLLLLLHGDKVMTCACLFFYALPHLHVVVYCVHRSSCCSDTTYSTR